MNITGPTDRDLSSTPPGDRLIVDIRRRLDGRPDDLPIVEQIALAHVRGLDSDDLAVRRPSDLAGAVCAHWALGRQRADGEVQVLVSSPDDATDGWSSSNSFVFVVCDDMPFLVDTVRMALESMGHEIQLLVHPMLSVTRGADGVVRQIGAGRAVEAWSMIEIDRVSADEHEIIGRRVTEAIAEVRSAVTDFDDMRVRMSDIASDLEHLPPEGVDAVEVDGVARLLRWLTRRNFVFLGAASYDRETDGSLRLLDESGLGLLRRDHVIDPPPSRHGGLLSIGRADAVSRVHRAARPMCVAVRRFDAAGDVRGEHRFVGLLAAPAYRASVLDIPHVRDRADVVLRSAGFPPESHDGRALRTILETFPRDEIFELDAEQLGGIASSILALADRHLVRVIPLPRTAGEWSTFLVFIPRSRFDVRLVERVGRVVEAAVGATAVETDSYVGTSALARISVALQRPDPDTDVDVDHLEQVIDDLTRPWSEDVRRELAAAYGEAEGAALAARVLPGVPGSYQASTRPRDAVADLALVGSLVDGALATRITVGSSDMSTWRVKVMRSGDPLALSDLVPVLENLGMWVRDETAHVLSSGPSRIHSPSEANDGSSDRVLGLVHLHDVGVEVPDAVHGVDEAVRTELQRVLEGVISGEIENDGFNRLVLSAGLTGGQAAVLRAYAKYLRQIGFPFSQRYIEEALARHPVVARGLVDVFSARFDPAISDRARVESERVAAVIASLDDVPSLDDDRIARTLLQLVRATVRTNHHRRDRRALALKFDPGSLPDLPAPRPWAEVWVCSPEVEGVHLRGGPIARGGIRWSDRREDFRTEILGLVKAQMVKNAVIVPVGAKGGFVVKRPNALGSPSAEVTRDEVVSRYRDFISALLDVTDDIRDSAVSHPPDVVRHDGDDPYLVVAADKGTSNLSDVANEISCSRGFWLGDAFASGGSAGYDHKDMGITARGAWESVRRHARTLGLDADRDELTVVGVGDMSGDVFGNGMLRSPHLLLVAAFDHRHIFLDPDPDPEVSYVERLRLFGLERSSWADYDQSLISTGGMVVPRTSKQVTLSDQVRRRLDVRESELTPDELIRAILRAPVDLLWNGGIGTYVKSSTESDRDVGDRANDAVRVDGCELRCRIVGEGGNLGFTQRGRIEFARRGGLVHTDAIDNSAGVDCSDHEVNIKVLLADAVTAGRLDRSERDELLVSMTDEVAELVLDDNRAQTLALAIARRQSVAMVDVHRRYIDLLESEGWLDRTLEDLPSDRELADRQAAGEGLAVPEFAVLLAYTKNADIAEVIRTDLPDDPYLVPELRRYFPGRLRERFSDLIEGHRLRREIIATSIVNQMVNTNGITFDHRLTEETGASTADVARAWLAARDIVDAPSLWERVEELETSLKPEVHLDLLLELRRMVERSTLWLLRHRRPADIAATVERLGSGVRRVRDVLPDVLVGPLASTAHSSEASRLVSGVPDDLATASAVWPLLHTAFDVVEVGLAVGRPEHEVAAVYWKVFDVSGAIWAWEGVGALPRSGRWATQARSALRDDLMAVLADLTADVLRASPGAAPDEAVERWLSRNEQSVTRARLVQADILRSGTRDLTTLSVSLRQLHNVLLAGRASAD